MTRAELKERAKAALTGNWGLVIAALLVQGLIVGLLDAPTTLRYPVSDDFTFSLSLGGLVVSGTLSVGLSAILLTMLRGGKADIPQLFSGFTTCFVASLIANLISSIVGGLAMLLLIVPGIIVELMFSQTFYILADDPNLSAVDALKASAEMMKGHKLELFVLELSFLPWLLLCVFVLPLLYVAPYMCTTMAVYYEYVSGNLNQS